MGAPKFSYRVQVPSDNIPTYKSVWAEGCPMPDTYLDGRPVYLGDADLRGCDSFFMEAWYADTDEPLSDDELDALTEQEQDRLVEMNCERFGWYRK